MALAAGAFVIALGPISDGDIYWHLAAGRAMVAHHALLRTDPFTLSAAGRPWIDVHWLFQLGAWAVYRMAGFPGLALVKAALLAATAVILARAAAKQGGSTAPLLCASMLLPALYLARHLLPLRPVIVTAFCLAVFLWALESARAGTTRRLWLLPPLQVLWVNCQGLAPLGLALIGAYVLEAALAARGGSRSTSPERLRAPSAASLVVAIPPGIPPPRSLRAGAPRSARLGPDFVHGLLVIEEVVDVFVRDLGEDGRMALRLSLGGDLIEDARHLLGRSLDAQPHQPER